MWDGGRVVDGEEEEEVDEEVGEELREELGGKEESICVVFALQMNSQGAHLSVSRTATSSRWGGGRVHLHAWTVKSILYVTYRGQRPAGGRCPRY